MKFKLVLSKLAQNQILQAYNYYQSLDSQRVHLNFLKDLDKTAQKLKTNPYFRFWTKKYRGVLLDKFPFIVFFRIEGDSVKIIAVFHTSQDPDKYPI